MSRSDISCARIAHYHRLHHDLNKWKSADSHHNGFYLGCPVHANKWSRQTSFSVALFGSHKFNDGRTPRANWTVLYVNFAILCYGCLQELLPYLPLLWLTTAPIDLLIIDKGMSWRQGRTRLQKSVFHLITGKCIWTDPYCAGTAWSLCVRTPLQLCYINMHNFDMVRAMTLPSVAVSRLDVIVLLRCFCGIWFFGYPLLVPACQCESASSDLLLVCAYVPVWLCLYVYECVCASVYAVHVAVQRRNFHIIV